MLSKEVSYMYLMCIPERKAPKGISPVSEDQEHHPGRSQDSHIFFLCEHIHWDSPQPDELDHKVVNME